MMLEYCGKEIKSEKAGPDACLAERKVMGEECIRWIRDVWG